MDYGFAATALVRFSAQLWRSSPIGVLKPHIGALKGWKAV